MNLDVRHLRLVAAIASEGGVTRAGNRLHLTQSALSHQLRDLEERLGAPLFDRTQKKMVLTAAGKRLLSTAHSVLEELRQAEDDIRRVVSGREGVIRISTQCYTNYHWLPSRLKAFHRDFPNVEVEVVVEATREPFKALLDGKLDLAIVNEVARDRRLSYSPLFSAEHLVVMRPDHRLASRSFIRAEDFADETLISYGTLEENTAFQRILRPAGIVPRRLQRVQLTEAIIEMVKAGLGISVVSRWALAPQLASGALIARPLTRHGMYCQWSAATFRSKSRPSYLDAFVKLLAEEPTLLERAQTGSGRLTSDPPCRIDSPARPKPARALRRTRIPD
jgi:LysR family transcriptional regulator for metE and metH